MVVSCEVCTVRNCPYRSGKVCDYGKVGEEECAEACSIAKLVSSVKEDTEKLTRVLDELGGDMEMLLGKLNEH